MKGFALGDSSGWQDSNLRPPGPKPGAITGLRYIPNLKIFDGFIGTPDQYKTYKNFCGECGIRSAAAEQFSPAYSALNKSAERVGFEPTVQFNPYDDLANRSFRPLRHLSSPKYFIS